MYIYITIGYSIMGAVPNLHHDDIPYAILGILVAFQAYIPYCRYIGPARALTMRKIARAK